SDGGQRQRPADSRYRGDPSPAGRAGDRPRPLASTRRLAGWRGGRHPLRRGRRRQGAVRHGQEDRPGRRGDAAERAGRPRSFRQEPLGGPGMFDLSGKTALVTGATGGIGGAIAAALHAQGAHVVLSGTREAVLADVAGRLGERISTVTANLSDAGAVDALVDAAEGAAGAPLDILVANAGITRDGLILRMKDEDWDSVIRVNLESYFRLA